MAHNTNIDYVNTFFEYPILTKIEGNPTYEQLIVIKDQLKANTASVSSDLGLGGGAGMGTWDYFSNLPSMLLFLRSHMYDHCTLDISLYLRELLSINNNCYVTNVKKTFSCLKEIVNLEKCLIKQLVQVVPDVYLKRFRNHISNSITTPLPDILASLFTTYGEIEDDVLIEKISQLENKVYDINEPLTVMYNDVEDLLELSTAANNTYSDRQIVNLGVKLIGNMNDFERAYDNILIHTRNCFY